jgi:hypothetical protein
MDIQTYLIDKQKSEPGLFLQIVIESKLIDGSEMFVVLAFQNFQILQIVESQRFNVLQKSERRIFLLIFMSIEKNLVFPSHHFFLNFS